MRLFTTLILSLFVFVAACCADAYAERHTDLLKRLAPPPPLSLSKRAPAFKTGAAGYGCDNGYEQCPGFNYCCQAGLTCFSDGTCGTMDELTCMQGETVCGTGTKAGCCPIKSSCVGNATCVVNSGDVVRRCTVGGLSAAAAVGGVMAAVRLM